MQESRGWSLVAFTCLIGVLCQRSGASYVYTHDEANRLIQIKAADNSVLAGYTYDALGRRIVASIGGETTRYYYDGQNVVEERDAAENRLRYHVNGSQYIDERVCTYTDATGEFTYYLLKENFSVAGTGNADGSVITPAGYSSTGSFAGFGFAVADFDRDNDVDQSDFGHLQICLTGADLGPVYAGCEDADLDNDDDVDQTDVMVWFACFSGPNIPPPADCRTTPTSGSFTLHGRPVDVLPDGNALLYVRARYYDLRNGRWFQRDSVGYADSPNLYESFASNATRFVDPSGRWIAERVAEILAEKGQLTVGDVQALGKELYSDARHEVGGLTDNELELLKLLGGPQYGTPWTETTLSPWLQDEAQKRYAGLGAAYRNRAMATLATRRRILYLLAFNSSGFSNYVTELYRVSRDVNPLHFAAERGIQVGMGTETITGQKVSRWRAGPRRQLPDGGQCGSGGYGRRSRGRRVRPRC